MVNIIWKIFLKVLFNKLVRNHEDHTKSIEINIKYSAAYFNKGPIDYNRSWF